MIVTKDKDFEPCPEFTGKAVCVDVTPLHEQQSQFGARQVFKIVFEVDLTLEDGKRACVWSNNFTPSLHEKSNLRKFLRQWFGRDLTDEELESFDTESLIGKPAMLVVIHDFKDHTTYANIASCTPDKSGSPLLPSGKFIRKQDRAAAGVASSNGSYHRTAAPAAGAEPVDYAAVKVHVGKCKGLELRDLSPEQVKALIDHWLPTAKANAKPTADDKRLIAALDVYSKNTAPKPDVPEDDVPF